MPPMSTMSDQPKSASRSVTVRFASASFPAMSIVGCPSLKLGSTKYGLPMMLNALTILASGSARWTRSPSESSPLIESFGGKPAEKSSGFIASITTLPAKLSRPASAITSSAASPRTAKTSSSLPAAASAGRCRPGSPLPLWNSHSRSSGFSGGSRESPMVTFMATSPEPGGQAAAQPHPFPNTPTRVLRQSFRHLPLLSPVVHRIYRRAWGAC